LIPERIQRLTNRVKSWVSLGQKPISQRKIAIILYGFPPGYGAVGTAALLNVPRSLIKLLNALKAQGYTVGDIPEDGEELIRQIKAADENPTPTLPLARGGGKMCLVLILLLLRGGCAIARVGYFCH